MKVCTENHRTHTHCVVQTWYLIVLSEPITSGTLLVHGFTPREGGRAGERDRKRGASEERARDGGGRVRGGEGERMREGERANERKREHKRGR